MASYFTCNLLVVTFLLALHPQVYCDKLLQLSEEQNRVFNFITGGLAQIVWTEDPLPGELSSSCRNSLTKIESSLNEGEEWPFRCK